MKYQELLNQLETGQLTGKNLYERRLGLMQSIEKITGRPLIVYAAKIEAHREAPNTIVLDDLLGFSDLTADIESDEIDVFIESPGGGIDAAHRIVNLLRDKFKSIRFLVPGSAYSAATMICLSGDEILMDERACLGPIDPQINGIPARSIINGFNSVREILKKQGPGALPAYLPLLQKYDLHIFEICKDAEERGKKLVAEWLMRYMLLSDKQKKAKTKTIVKFFSNYDDHKSHARPIFFSDAKAIGVKVNSLSDNPALKSNIWDLYLHIKIMFDASFNVKIYENSHGVNWGKNFQDARAIRPIQVPMPIPAQPPQPVV